jgi:hypothetical protein
MFLLEGSFDVIEHSPSTFVVIMNISGLEPARQQIHIGGDACVAAGRQNSRCGD